MISNMVIEALKSFIPSENIHIDEPMAAHTTFKVGGPVDCLIEVENTEELVQIINYLNKLEMPFLVIGNGSNMLVSDKGYKGIVLEICSKMNKVAVEGTKITAQAGSLMGAVARTAYENSLTGLEFAQGIPGTIGGGVVMNAGAYGGEMSQVVTSVKVVTTEGEILELDNETMEFGYRHSVIRNQKFVVTEVSFELKEGKKEEIKAKMDDFAKQRRDKQPLEYPSAGSTFKRPEGYFAGKLIQDAELRGYSIGGAQVSEKHCGFVINKGDATASDIYALIKHIQMVVKDKFNVDLETEVVLVGSFK